MAVTYSARDLGFTVGEVATVPCGRGARIRYSIVQPSSVGVSDVLYYCARGLFLVFALAVSALASSHSIGVVTVTPMTAVIGSPTQVSVEASIADSALINDSVNLLKLDAHGNTIAVLGTLHDDGLNGDTFAGDKVFTLVVTLNSASASQIQLQVSAAFKGVLLRTRSNVVSVFFQAPDAPQQAIRALARNLIAGNLSAVLQGVVPSSKTNSVTLAALPQQGLAVLASILQNGVLVVAKNDLRIFQSNFVTPQGNTAVLEFSLVPGPNGQWLVNSW